MTYLDRTYRGIIWQEGGLADPLSGMSKASFWPYEADLIRMLNDAGFPKVSVLGKDLVV